MKILSSLCVALALLVTVLGCGNRPGMDDVNLNSLTTKEYNAFVYEIFTAHRKDPQTVGEKAKQIIIGMAGLENRPESHGVFEVDVNFNANANAMLLLVANANNIKREKEFIQEFEHQIKATRPQLRTEHERIYFDVFTALLLNQQEQLRGKPGDDPEQGDPPEWAMFSVF
jgi:hypothetical protein